MFLDTNVTDLKKNKLGSPNSFLKKTRKTAIFSASLVGMVDFTGSGLRIAEYGLRITVADYGLRIADYRLRIADYGLRIADY